MTIYRALVALAWISSIGAVMATAPIFGLFERILAAILIGHGFGELWRAQRPIAEAPWPRR